MKVEQMLLLPVTLTIVQISDSLAVSIMNDPVTPCCSPSASVENSSDSKDKGTLDFFECFVKEWNSNYSECYDVFLSYWNSGETTENSRDDKIEGRFFYDRAFQTTITSIKSVLIENSEYSVSWNLFFFSILFFSQ